METVESKYYCRTCGSKNESEFYSYLKSKCMGCKKKESRDVYNEKINSKKDEELEKILDDKYGQQIRNIFLHLFTREKLVCNSTNTILSTLNNLDDILSDLIIRTDDKFTKIGLNVEKLSIENARLDNEINSKNLHYEKIISMQNDKIKNLEAKVSLLTDKIEKFKSI